MRRVFVLTVVGILALGSLAIMAYGMTAMFTSNGVEAPNIIVWLGLAGIALMAAAAVPLWRQGAGLK